VICLGNRHILVAGGGIGGLSAALAAARKGFDVTVLEKAAEFVELGAGLQLAPNATRVLKRFGVLEDVLDAGVLPDRLVLASAITGEELTSLDVRDFDTMYGGPYVVMHRADLLAILYRACAAMPSVELRPNKAVVAVSQPDPGTVVAHCADGSHISGDALIGADGLHSVVRKLIVDSEPICSGYVAYRGAVPVEEVASRSASRDVVAFIGPELHFVQYQVRRGELYNQVAVFRSRRYEAGEADWGAPDELDERFSVACEQVRIALKAINRDMRWPMYDREPLDTWRNGQAVLLGDAAHPMLQYLAQGACQALEDSDSLASAMAAAVGAGRGVVDAFEDYQRRRIPATARVQRNARLWGDLWHADGLLQLMRDIYLRERDPDDHRHVVNLYQERPNGGTETGAAHTGAPAAGSPKPASVTATTQR
jgi:3-hydroxybenzoate 6-monooxygenase